MAFDLYGFVGLYDRVLGTLSHLLTKGAEHAQATGATEAEMLDWRLIQDMHALRFQVRVVCNFTRKFTAEVAGLPAPADIDSDLNLAQLQAAIADARAYLATLTPAQFEGRDDVPLTIPIGATMKPTFPAERWLSVFATTNIYFHLSTAYGILRAHGAPIGKMDLFAGGL